MFKFIVTAKKHTDIINLMVNTSSVDVQKVKWNAGSVSRSYDDATCKSEIELSNWVKAGKWYKVDDAIMGGDVPTGGMVVVCDEKTNPSLGFVCGNGNSWYEVILSKEIVVSILKQIHSNARFFVVGSIRSHTFSTKDEAVKWIETCTEQTRYMSLIDQINSGKTVIDYNA